MKKTRLMLLTVLMALVLLVTACSAPAEKGTDTKPASAGNTTASTSDAEKPVLTITSMYFSAEPPTWPEFEAKMAEYSGYEIDVTWIPSTGYEDKFNTMLASDALTMLNIPSNLKSNSFLQACKDGLFWELDDYVGNYANLMKIGDARFNNVRVDGKIMGVPRGRDLVRQGLVYRDDLSKALGFERPSTVEEIDKLARAYMADGGLKYGMTQGAAGGTPEGVGYLAIYLGAPNGYGIDSEGNFNHYFNTKEYKQAVEQFATWYQDGVLNANFVELTAEDGKKLINTEEAGIVWIYTDDVSNRFADLYVKNPDASLDYILSVNDTTFGTAGFNTAFVMSKSQLKDEGMLAHAMTWLDKLGDQEYLDFRTWGFEGENYDLNDDGIPQRTQDQETKWSATGSQYGQLNWCGGVIVSRPGVTIPVIERLNAERLLYVDTCKMDASTPFVSETWTLSSADLNPIMYDAINKRIMGVISSEEYDAQVKRWLEVGGQKVIDEFKAAYEASK